MHFPTDRGRATKAFPPPATDPASKATLGDEHEDDKIKILRYADIYVRLVEPRLPSRQGGRWRARGGLLPSMTPVDDGHAVPVGQPSERWRSASDVWSPLAVRCFTKGQRRYARRTVTCRAVWIVGCATGFSRPLWHRCGNVTSLSYERNVVSFRSVCRSRVTPS
jgi:hypothetical protein